MSGLNRTLKGCPGSPSMVSIQKWGVPAMFLAIPYLGIAYLLSTVVENGGPDWLNLFIFVAVWSALKMLWIGPDQPRSPRACPCPRVRPAACRP